MQTGRSQEEGPNVIAAHSCADMSVGAEGNWAFAVIREAYQ